MEQTGSKQALVVAKEMSELPTLIFSKAKFQIFEKNELSPPQISVLQILYDNPSGMKMSDLAGKMHSSTPSATGIVSRLVEKKFVIRGDDPKDRRIVTASITKKGEMVLREFQKDVERMWSGVLNDFSKKEIEDFLRLVRKVKRILREDNNG